MTEDKIALKALLEQASDADFLRDIIGFAAGRMMALEVEALTGADYLARNPERSNSRNGYRERSWETRAGTLFGLLILWVQRHRQRRQPRHMEPWQLRDLGIQTQDALRESRKPCWRA